MIEEFEYLEKMRIQQEIEKLSPHEIKHDPRFTSLISKHKYDTVQLKSPIAMQELIQLDYD